MDGKPNTRVWKLIDIKKYCMSYNMNPYYQKVLEKVAFVIA